MLKDATEAERAERDQDADCAGIDAATAMAEQEIAALEGRHLDPHEIRREWSAIRDRTILAIRDMRRNVANRASDAKAIEDAMVEKLVAKRATAGLWVSFQSH